jgi:hypothetical protein
MNDTQKKLVAVAVFAAAVVALGTAVAYAYHQNTSLQNTSAGYSSYGQSAGSKSYGYSGSMPYGANGQYGNSAQYGSYGQYGGMGGMMGGIGGYGMMR